MLCELIIQSPRNYILFSIAFEFFLTKWKRIKFEIVLFFYILTSLNPSSIPIIRAESKLSLSFYSSLLSYLSFLSLINFYFFLKCFIVFYRLTNFWPFPSKQLSSISHLYSVKSKITSNNKYLNTLFLISFDLTFIIFRFFHYSLYPFVTFNFYNCLYSYQFWYSRNALSALKSNVLRTHTNHAIKV